MSEQAGLPHGPSPAPVNDPETSSRGLAKAARSSAVNLVGAAISTLASFGLVVIIARGMSQAEAGVFFSTTSMFLVATSIGQLGTDLGLVYFLSRTRALAKLAYIGDYLRAAMKPVLTISAVLSAGMLVLAPWLASITNRAHVAEATSDLRLLALFVVPTCVGSTLLAATRGLGTMRPYVVVEQLGRQLTQVLLVGMVVTHAGWLVALAWALPYIGWLIAAYAWFRRIRARYLSRDSSPRIPVDAEFWRFTAPRTLSSVAQLLLQRIDIVIVSALAGASQAALFTASTRFTVAGQMGSYAVSMAIQPVLAGALARADLRTARHVFQTSTAWLIGITWPLYLVFCVFGGTLLAVFGHGYPDGAEVLTLATLGMLIGAACGDVDSVLVMSGMTARSLANTTLGLAVMIGLDLWLVPSHGALGAAAGWGLAVAVKNVAGLIQIWISFRLHPFSRAAVTMAALNVVCFGVLGEAILRTPVHPFARLIIALAVMSAAYLGGLWMLRGPLQLSAFRALRSRTPAGMLAHADQN